MNKSHRPFLLPLLAAAWMTAAAVAQQATAPSANQAGHAPPAGTSPATGAQPAAKAFSQQDLDQLLAPIALYPDNLLAQILMASTYPLEVVQAARWRAANPDVKDGALQDAMQKETWDPSVKGLTAVPQVLKQMDENLEWLQKLGDAFLAQQSDVMGTVQSLRKKAKENGNLESTPQMHVKTETAEEKTVYVIESTKTETVYVPTYNPSVVYGAWPYYGYPPYYMYPPAYVYPPGLTFTFGIIVGGAIWGGCGWGGNDVYINHNDYNNFNRTDINNDIGNGDRGDRVDRGDRGNGNRAGNNPSWKHNPDHRGGVPYRDNATAERFNRGGDNRAAQARDSFRGRGENGGLGGGASAGTRDLSAGTRDMGSRDMGARDTGSRDAGSRNSGARDTGSPGGGDRGSRGGGGGFSGMNSGSSARAASSRGSSSFGGRSPGGFGGGGGGRRRR